MRLIFIKAVGRFKKGEIKDYPADTWKAIALSANQELSTFTKQADDVASSVYIDTTTPIDTEIKNTEQNQKQFNISRKARTVGQGG